MSADKHCVILLAMGGPDSLEAVKPYIRNIFSDRSIIRLPGGPMLQKPFARLIAQMRYKKVRSHYGLIGGSSPLLKWTESQARHLEDLLRPTLPGFRCYVGMRYYQPYTQEAVARAYADGFRRIYFVPMYPQYSKATTGSSFEAAGQALRSMPNIQPTFVKDFHDDPAYITLLRKYIFDNIRPDETLLFSAHSLPQKFVDEGDPYVDQIRRTAELAAGNREYYLSFQSRTGPVQWVGPDTIEETRRLLTEKKGGLFIVPIAFVCDHIETMYEIDIELKGYLEPSQAARIRRMPMFNDDPAFADVLAGIVRERLLQYAGI